MNHCVTFQFSDQLNINSVLMIYRSRLHVEVLTVGKVIASSKRELILKESPYKPAFYFPRNDVEEKLSTASSHTTYCACKGDSAYFHIPLAGDRGWDAAWTYVTPYGALRLIEANLAFRTKSIIAFVTRGGE